MDRMILDFDVYSKAAILAAAEGQVLLRNDNQALPLKEPMRWQGGQEEPQGLRTGCLSVCGILPR